MKKDAWDRVLFSAVGSAPLGNPSAVPHTGPRLGRWRQFARVLRLRPVILDQWTLPSRRNRNFANTATNVPIRRLADRRKACNNHHGPPQSKFSVKRSEFDPWPVIRMLRRSIGEALQTIDAALRRAAWCANWQVGQVKPRNSLRRRAVTPPSPPPSTARHGSPRRTLILTTSPGVRVARRTRHCSTTSGAAPWMSSRSASRRCSGGTARLARAGTVDRAAPLQTENPPQTFDVAACEGNRRARPSGRCRPADSAPSPGAPSCNGRLSTVPPLLTTIARETGSRAAGPHRRLSGRSGCPAGSHWRACPASIRTGGGSRRAPRAIARAIRRRRDAAPRRPVRGARASPARGMSVRRIRLAESCSTPRAGAAGSCGRFRVDG